MSYVAVDLDNHKVLFKTADMRSACLLSAMDHEHTTHLIFPIERKAAIEDKRDRPFLRFPEFLTVSDMRKFHANLVAGEMPTKIGDLMREVHDALVDLPCSKESLFDLERRAGAADLPADVGLPDPANKPPTYQPVSVPAKERLSVPAAPSIPPAPSADAPWLRPAPSIPSAPTGIPSAPPGIPTAPKPPSVTSAPSAPKAGSTTGRVWAIADQTLSDVPTPISDWKEFKRVVVEECATQGINPGTAGTQFGAWKKAKGL